MIVAYFLYIAQYFVIFMRVANADSSPNSIEQKLRGPCLSCYNLRQLPLTITNENNVSCNHSVFVTQDKNQNSQDQFIVFDVQFTFANATTSTLLTTAQSNTILHATADALNISVNYFQITSYTYSNVFLQNGNVDSQYMLNVSLAVKFPANDGHDVPNHDPIQLQKKYENILQNNRTLSEIDYNINQFSIVLNLTAFQYLTVQQSSVANVALLTEPPPDAVSSTDASSSDSYRQWAVAFGICALLLMLMMACICAMYVQEKALQQRAEDDQERHQNLLQTDYLHQLLNQTAPNNVNYAMEQQSCLACGDIKPRYQIVQCGGERLHRFCLDCLERYVLMCIGEGAALSFDILHTKGSIQCPACAYLFPASRICKSVSPTTLEKYLRVYVQVSEDFLILQQSLQQKDRQLQDILERNAEQHYRHIVEEVLTLHCPNPTCRQVFVDFENCYALTCGKCKQAFCAWCLEACQKDAHRHVRQCIHNLHPGKEVYADPQLFHVAHRSRRQEAVYQYLQQHVLQKDRDEVLRLLRPHLIELQLEVILSSSY